MKNELIPFEFEGRAVRGVFMDGQEWLVAKDVCGLLGISKYRQTLETTRKDKNGEEYVNFPEDEKGVLELGHPSGGKQKTLCVNEPGVYRLIHRAHTPQAERFKHMVYHDILPEIRKTGALVPEGMMLVNKTAFDEMSAENEHFRQVLPKIEALVDSVQEQKKLRDENERLERRYQFSPDDKREILSLHSAGYNVSQIMDKTKKGRTRIKRVIEEAAAASQPGLFGDEAMIAAARGKGVEV
jgi:prophage antirepressor-like protein